MTGNKKNLDEMLDRHLGLFKASSRKEPDAAMETILNRIQSQAAAMPEERSSIAVRDRFWRPRRLFLLAAAAAFALAALVAVDFRKTQIDPQAVVTDGSFSRITAKETRIARVGDAFEFGDAVRSNDVSGTIKLKDGSSVELHSESELVLERANDGVQIHLNRGIIIVTAAAQGAGHLYVQTKDATVSVVGTVFLVSVEEVGSRVAVIEGAVQVQQSAESTKLRPGEQLATSPAMQVVPIPELIKWSRNAASYLALLQQSLTALQPPPVIVKPPVAAQNAPAANESFEVASIRSMPAPGGGGRGGDLLSGYPPSCYGVPQVDPKRFAISNTTLYHLITLAYGKSCEFWELLPPTDGLSGGPGWVRADRWDVQAVIPEGSPSYTAQQFRRGEAPQLQKMIQTLLADRFKLVLRKETKEMPVYLLTVGKDGPKFTEWKEGDRVTLGAFNVGPNRDNTYFVARIAGNKGSMTDLSKLLEAATLRPILNRTGLQGDFNFEFFYAPTADRFPELANSGRLPFLPSPSLFTSIEENLGLKLEAARAPVELLVIDHVEKPSPNQ